MPPEKIRRWNERDGLPDGFPKGSLTERKARWKADDLKKMMEAKPPKRRKEQGREVHGQGDQLVMRGLNAEQRAVIQMQQLFWAIQTIVAFAHLVTTGRLTCMEVGCTSESILGRTCGEMKLSHEGNGLWNKVNLVTGTGYHQTRAEGQRPRLFVLHRQACRGRGPHSSQREFAKTEACPEKTLYFHSLLAREQTKLGGVVLFENPLDPWHGR